MGGGRIVVFRIAMTVVVAAIVVKLFWIAVIDHGFYAALAGNQHDVERTLTPERGEIFVRDALSDKVYPVATNREVFTVAAEPRVIKDPSAVAHAVASALELDELVVKEKLSLPLDPYEVLVRQVSVEVTNKLRALNLPGIIFESARARSYPESGIGGHIVGFVGSDEEGSLAGRYGLEAAFDEVLRGLVGKLVAEKDIGGRLIPLGKREVEEATDGADLVLTIDRTVQFTACDALKRAVAKHGADGGSVIIADPKTGAIIALCSAPDYDPNAFGKITDPSVFLSPAVSRQYEPGSIMKPITLAAAMEQGAISPRTTYEDTGVVKIGPEEIKNSDEKSNGVVDMTEVLVRSLNTGAIFAMRSIGPAKFRSYLERFGFGTATGIEIAPEAKGDLAALKQRGEIYAATASFGQGISVTPLQMLMAFGALANNGKLMKPYLVAEMRRADGTATKTAPVVVRQVISERTATLIGGMLTAVVERGHGKRAAVKGYYVGGKTGTAQVPRKDGRGYETDVTIGSFIGFAPVQDPKFVMITRIDHPRDVKFAESSAAPLFGELAKFLLSYYKIPPERTSP